jgi:hypothetical protein
MKSHNHTDDYGIVHRCYHNCKNVLFDLSFWIGITLSFPLEHYLYEKVYPFTLVAKFLGV